MTKMKLTNQHGIWESFSESPSRDHENHLILSISSSQDLPLFSGSHFSFVAERKKKKNLFA